MNFDDERVTRLETRLAYLDDYTQQIQKVVLEQGEQLERLSAENRHLLEKITELSDNQPAPGHTRPPHY